MKKAITKAIQLWDSNYPVSVTITLHSDDVQSLTIMSDYSPDHPIVIQASDIKQFTEMIDEVKKYDSH